MSGGLFAMSAGMVVVLGILAGTLQWAKYSMLSSSISWIPAILSNTQNTIPDGIGIILALTIDFLQKAMWSGIQWRDGLTKKEWAFVALAVSLLLAEFMGIAAPILVPDALSMPTGDIPVVFWTRLFTNLFGPGFLYAISGLGLTIALAALPEFMHEEASKTFGEFTAWVLFACGILLGQVIFSIITGAPVLPSINWF